MLPSVLYAVRAVSTQGSVRREPRVERLPTLSHAYSRVSIPFALIQPEMKLGGAFEVHHLVIFSDLSKCKDLESLILANLSHVFYSNNGTWNRSDGPECVPDYLLCAFWTVLVSLLPAFLVSRRFLQSCISSTTWFREHRWTSVYPLYIDAKRLYGAVWARTHAACESST